MHALLRRVRCAAQLGRGLAKLAALKQTRALFPPKSALLAVPDGRVGAGTDGCCCAAAPCCLTRRARLRCSAVGRRRSAHHIKQIDISAAGCTGTVDFVCPFASSPDPDCPVGQRREPRSGPDFGSPFLGLLSFGEAKESGSAAGTNPRPPPSNREQKPQSAAAPKTHKEYPSHITPPPPPSDQSPQTDSPHCAPSSRCGSCPHTS